MKHKSEVSTHLQNFILLVQNQFSMTVKTIRIDQGTKIFNSDVTSFLQTHGIVHQISCVYTTQ